MTNEMPANGGRARDSTEPNSPGTFTYVNMCLSFYLSQIEVGEHQAHDREDDGPTSFLWLKAARYATDCDKRRKDEQSRRPVLHYDVHRF